MIPKIMDDTKSLKELVNDKTCIGRLSECSECYVEEERNGAYTLTLSVPITAKYYSKLKLGGILKVKSNQEDDEQLFRIETITEPYGDLVEVLANHISYDLLKTTVKPCSTTGADNACKLIMQNMTGGSAFTISTDFVGTRGKFNNEIPQPARSLFGGQDGSLIDTYGGEWHFDNLTCELLKSRGIDRNVQLRYGKNITSIEQEKNIESLYTHIQPYVTVESEAIVGTLHELTKVSDDNIKIYNLDLTSKFDTTETTPSVEDIDKACDTYIKNNDLTTPKVNIKLEYVNLAEVQEYKELFMSEKVALCDTVHIYFPKLDINASAKVISYKYNVLKERYEELEIGDTKSSFVGTIAGIEEESKKYADDKLNGIENSINVAVDKIKAGSGGNVALHDSKDDTNDIVRNEIYAYDGDTIATSNNVLRINNAGIAGTDEGVNGNYHVAITVDGHINGEWISANTIQSSSFADDVRAKIEMAVTYDEAKNDVISWINASADNIILNTKKLIFGVYPDGQYIEVSNYYSGSTAIGVLFDGNGRIAINSKGTITLTNKIDSFEWNKLYMYAGNSDHTYNQFRLYNYQLTKVMANELAFVADGVFNSTYGTSNYTIYRNYKNASSWLTANQFNMVGGVNGNLIALNNYQLNYTNLANEISLICKETESGIKLYNHDYKDHATVNSMSLVNYSEAIYSELSVNKNNGDGSYTGVGTIMIYYTKSTDSAVGVFMVKDNSIRIEADGTINIRGTKLCFNGKTIAS